MWEWIIRELDLILRTVDFSHSKYTLSDADDIKQEVLKELIEKPSVAKNIYNEKKKYTLYQMCRNKIYTELSKLYFTNRDEFKAFSQIARICQDNDIEMIKENAYKIWACADSKSLSISYIERLLSQKHDIEKTRDDNEF